MYLKQLELNGFKSFAERTVFAFGPGITAIVGPNGAGKSNVADAIRWVLGEQNPRLLRGTRMEDVIFNGSEGRRPLGLAEVLLTLDNSDGALPTEFTEVTVGRRVDRAGGSDYLINGSSCRLRDVQELFYDTGLGREAYSLVGQGRVDEVLAARPEERRALLEEAAGIVRFKARKQEALRRLASVEERLVRLGDILGEIEARLGPLEAAAEQARRHRQLLAELRSVELRLERWLWVRALARWRDKHRQVEALRTEQQTWRHELETTSRRLVDLRRQLAERERDLEAARTAFEQSAGQWEQLRARRQVLAERRRGLAQRLDQLQQEHAALEAERAEHTRRVSGEQAQQAELEQRVQEHGGKRKELEQALAAAEALHAELEQALARARQDVLAALGETAEAEKRRARDEARLQAIRTQREQLDAALARWQEQWASLAERHRHCSQELAQQRERAQAALAQAQELESRRRRLAAVGERAQQRLVRLQERLADARGRVRLLESLQQNYEGFYGGVRTVLRGRDRGEPAFADVIGVVAELITTPAGYQAALEAALAGALQYVVVRTGDGAQRAIEELRRRRAGRVTFLPLDGLRAGGPHEA
ncbi:MAG TPA: AAA family ATPase, partial [Bacillota bacterium]